MKFCSTLTLCFLFFTGWSQAADWPQWRGVDRNGHSRETGLLPTWPDRGPSTVWQIDTIGEGYSSLAVTGGRIYTQGNVDGKGTIFCLSEKDGSTLWSVTPPAESSGYRH